MKNNNIKKNFELLKELFFLILHQKKYWLLPFLLLLGFLGVFVSISGNTSVLPAIYALF